MYQADPRGLLVFLAVAMCWALALVLFRVGMPGSAARRLSLLLVAEGITLGTSDATGFFLTSPGEWMRLHPDLAVARSILHTLGDCAMLALYPPFLAAALNTSLTRPFAGRRVQIGLASAALMLFATTVLTIFERIPPAPAFSVLYLALALLFWYSLAVSVHAWYTARGTARTRARYFALAFGVRDICWSFIYIVGLLELWSVVPAPDPNVVPNDFNVYTLGTLVAVPLIAYGILRSHLFDIDLRIRWTIKQSTLAAILIALFYLLSEGASRLLSAELGNFAGLFAAGIVVFLLVPVQRFAERVAGAAMPAAQNTPEYAAFRKLQVYEAAIAEALQGDGGISPRERALLNRLRDTLGVSATDAEALERDLAARNAGGRAGVGATRKKRKKGKKGPE